MDDSWISDWVKVETLCSVIKTFSPLHVTPKYEGDLYAYWLWVLYVISSEGLLFLRHFPISRRIRFHCRYKTFELMVNESRSQIAIATLSLVTGCKRAWVWFNQSIISWWFLARMKRWTVNWLERCVSCIQSSIRSSVKKSVRPASKCSTVHI